MYYARELVEKLNQSEHIVIFGARLVAAEVAQCLLEEPYNFKISNFMVTDLERNPSEMMGISVIDVEEGKRLYRDAVILVAVMEKYAGEIISLLQKAGFLEIVPMTFESDIWSEIGGNYYRELRLSAGKKYLTLEEELRKGSDGDCEAETKRRGLFAGTLCKSANGGSRSRNDISIYTARCHVDRKLTADLSAYTWETPIQVGAALTDRHISELRDDQGDNISAKNREYCELTALYWIWKNDISGYAGLCHYRRHFNLNEELVEKLAASDIDVVLTIPILNFPDVRTVYANDHVESDWDIMMEVLEELHPDYRETAEELQRGVFYYGYNMFIARKEILDDYCAWLFPVLEHCEIRCGKKEDDYQNRYIGFLAERLLSIYFLHNEDKYKIVHARKTFLTDGK